MEKIRDLNDLMIEQLRNLYDGERRVDELLPEMIDMATDEELKNELDQYLTANESQIMRIRQAFEELFVQKRGEVCDAMIAMVKETKELMKRCKVSHARDASIITSLQHIIHYQMAGYGAVCTYVQMLNMDSIAEVIHRNLEEEKLTDGKLIVLAENQINKKAAGMV